MQVCLCTFLCMYINVYVCVSVTEREVENSCIDLVLFAEYSEQKCKPWEHLEREGKWGKRCWWCQLSYWLWTKHTCTHTCTAVMCGGSLGSQSAALNKAFLFLSLIAVSICHWGVQFLISALTESGEVDVGRNTKWMHLLTNEIKPLHLHFSFFPPAGTMLPRFSSQNIELFPTNLGEGLADLQSNS